MAADHCLVVFELGFVGLYAVIVAGELGVMVAVVVLYGLVVGVVKSDMLLTNVPVDHN